MLRGGGTKAKLDPYGMYRENLGRVILISNETVRLIFKIHSYSSPSDRIQMGIEVFKISGKEHVISNTTMGTFVIKV